MKGGEDDSVPSVVLVGRQVADAGATAVLAQLGQTAAAVEEIPAALRRLGEVCPRLVVLSPTIPPAEGLALLERIRGLCPEAAVVATSDSPRADWAVRFIRAGACDYLPGPLDAKDLRQLLAGVESQAAGAKERADRFFLPDCPPGVVIAGRSEGLSRVLEMTRLVATSRCNPVLVLGETGTGKELIARGVHAWRYGQGSAFVAVNCATLSPALLESELFGHVKGAFTGADREKTGLLEAAAGGTILLDEISEMPAELQAKLLRFLQERTFRKVGGTADIPCKATVMASSNWALFEEAMAGRFRKDLYYRLAVFPIQVPPLRSPQRRGDIPLLAEYFLVHREGPPAGGPRGFSKAAVQELLRHDWPGNVRELRNVVERAVLLEPTEEVTPQSLLIERAEGSAASGAAQGVAVRGNFSLEAAERELIHRALQECNGQRTRAAAMLGITRATLYAKIKRYSLEPGQAPAVPACMEDPAAGRPQRGPA